MCHLAHALMVMCGVTSNIQFVHTPKALLLRAMTLNVAVGTLKTSLPSDLGTQLFLYLA